VGKSSAINGLVGRKALMRVSRTPGATRLINVLEWGQDLRLIDLPGYGYARVSRSERQTWARSMGDYLRYRSCLQHIVLVVDIRHALKESDLLMLELAREWSVNCTVLATKADRIKRNAATTRTRALKQEVGKGVEVLRHSAKSGEGRPRLLEIMLQALEDKE